MCIPINIPGDIPQQDIGSKIGRRTLRKTEMNVGKDTFLRSAHLNGNRLMRPYDEELLYAVMMLRDTRSIKMTSTYDLIYHLKCIFA